MMTQVLINGWFHRITKRNEIIYNGQYLPIVRDVQGNFWVLVEGDLIQLVTFTLDGRPYNFPGAVPDFFNKAPVSKLAEGVGFELSELDQYWNLDRTEFYMLVTYRIKEKNDPHL